MRRLFLLLLLSGFCFGQEDVVDPIPVSFVDMGSTCADTARIIRVIADTSGMTSVSGDSVGLNSFYLVIEISEPSRYGGIFNRTVPLRWTLYTSNPTVINSQNRIAVIGLRADPDAPSSAYELFDLVLLGPGPMELLLDEGASSLGTRRVLDTSNGPGNALPIDAEFIDHIDSSGALLGFGDGWSSWGTAHALYDEVAPFGVVDILDLIHFLPCFNSP